MIHPVLHKVALHMIEKEKDIKRRKQEGDQGNQGEMEVEKKI